jgi:hypothetical protein
VGDTTGGSAEYKLVKLETLQTYQNLSKKRKLNLIDLNLELQELLFQVVEECKVVKISN